MKINKKKEASFFLYRGKKYLFTPIHFIVFVCSRFFKKWKIKIETKFDLESS